MVSNALRGNNLVFPQPASGDSCYRVDTVFKNVSIEDMAQYLTNLEEQKEWGGQNFEELTYVK